MICSYVHKEREFDDLVLGLWQRKKTMILEEEKVKLGWIDVEQIRLL